MSLLGGASTAIGAETSGRSASAEQQLSAGTAGVPDRGIVGLRRVRPCTFEGTPTTCAIDVTRLRLSGDGQRVVAIGTVTPRGVPDAPSVPFRVPVRRVADLSQGAAGEGTLQGALSCDILRLVLGPLHLDVLGLVIDLNRVVLTIVGETGAGNLLGNLLCASPACSTAGCR